MSFSMSSAPADRRVWFYSRGAAKLPRSQRVEPLDGYAPVTLIGDCVASIHGLGQVPRQLHGDGARHACEFEVSHGSASEVVQDAPGQPALRQAVANALLNDLLGFGRSGPLSPFATMRKNTQGTTLPRFFRRCAWRVGLREACGARA